MDTTSSAKNERTARKGVRGLTLIEVMMASVVVTILILGAAAAFSETIGGARLARSLTSGVLFLETVSENVGAQPPANLLALHGNHSFDGPDAARSQYRVEVSVFEVQAELLQVELALFELSSGNRLGTVATQRSLR